MDAFVMIDWSAASDRGPVAGKADGLWAAVAEPGAADYVRPFRTRSEAREWVVEELVRLVGQGLRVLCGFDFSFGYPVGTASALGMPSGATAWRWMWERIAREVRDDEDGRNDRFAAAGRLNQAMDREDGPFWGNGLKGDITGLPRTKGEYPMAAPYGIHLEEFRTTERQLRDSGGQPSSGWQLSGAGSVGGQVLVGLPTLWRIRNHPVLKDRCRVWPFERPAPPDEPGVILAEVYPSLLDDDPTLHDVRDARQVMALVDGYRQMAADGALAGALELPDLPPADRAAVVGEEGWILSVVRDRSRPRTPTRPPVPAIPRGLVEAIAAGRCVAFVGAGFAATEVPTWGDLVTDLSTDPALPETTRRQVSALLALDQPGGQSLESAAQLIADALTDGQLRLVLRARLEEGLGEQSSTRRNLLGGIPFASIITTNVDPSLPGLLPGPAAYAELLRGEPMPWWHEGHWRVVDDDDEGATLAPRPPTVLKLHGDVSVEGSDHHLVFTTQDYRRRLSSDAGYLTFLRALLSTRTVLFLGVSFSDAHLNQIRSEVLALVGRDHGPLGYAVLPDVPPEQQDFYRSHEGLEVITYAVDGAAHDGFDDILRALHAEAGHDALLRQAVEGRTILWVDPPESRNAPGILRLRDVIGDALLLVGGASEARAVLRSRPVDLVVTHWGHREGGRPVGEEVLATVRSSRNPCPTLVFAWGDYADVNRPRAMALGATDYVWTWPALFREVTRVLAPAPRNPWDLAPRLDG